MHSVPTGAPRSLGEPFSQSPRRRLGRGAAGVALVAAVVGLWATAAFAHVTVNPKEASQGSFAKLSFRVPNERDNASTTKVVVQLPQDHPIPFISVRPTPGWTAQATKKKLTAPVKTDDGEVTEAVDTITWTGGKINPGEFQEFDLSVGPLPTDVDQLVFPAIQGYDNGEEVAWIEKPKADGEEPEHPAPVLKLTPKTSGHGASSPGATAASGVAVASKQDVAAPAPLASDSSSSTAVAWVGVVLGALALIVAIVAVARGARTNA